jgi:DNA-binding transcriptional MerR regulator
VTTYRISQLADRVGIRPATLRFYEQVGLLPARRSPAGHRLYDDDAIDRLRFVTAGKRLGLPLDEIADLLVVRDGGRCADVRDRLRPLLSSRIAEAERRSVELAECVELLRRVRHEVDRSARTGPCDPTCLELPDDAPPIACTLDDAGRVERVARWQALLANATGREAIPDGVRIGLPATLAGPAAELAAAEQSCCPFLDFCLRLADGELFLDVHAPSAAAVLLGELFDTTVQL